MSEIGFLADAKNDKYEGWVAGQGAAQIAVVSPAPIADISYVGKEAGVRYDAKRS